MKEYIKEYIKDLKELRDSLQLEADWESNGRAMYLKGKISTLTKVINELELMA